MNTFDISLDVGKGVVLSPPVILGQGDKAGATIRATIYDHGTQCDLTGMTAKFMLRSGAGYFEDAACTVSGSTITYVVDEEHAASVAGTAQAYFAIYQGSTHVYSTSRFDVKVLRAASSGADPAQSYSDDIVAATQAARAAADAANATVSAVEDAVEGIEDASNAAQQAVANATTAVTNATTAVTSAQQALTDATAAVAATEGAAETANGAAARAEDAIDAMGDISELAVPLMSADVRGGAKLGEGLALTDGALGIDLAPHESTGDVRGSIAALTAKGHAEQDGTPTPDAPVPIQVVRGRNLLENTATSQTVRNVDLVVNEDGSISAKGTPSSAFQFPIGTMTLDAGTYMLSGCPSGGSYSSYVLRIEKFPESSLVALDTGNGAQFTLSESANVAARMYVYATIEKTFYPQIELGSVATPYVPYGHVGMEAQTRNLLDESKSVNGKVVNSTTGAEASNASYRHSDYIPVTENTTYFMSNGLGIGTMYGGAIYDANKQYLRGITFTGANNQSGSFDTGADAAYVILNYYVPTNARYVAPPQLELGSVAHDYEPYYHETRAIPLPQRGWVAGVSDGTADVLTLDGAGKVTWVLNDAEVVLDGSENWGVSAASGKSFAYTALAGSMNLGGPESLQRLRVDRFALSVAQTPETAYQSGNNLLIFTGTTFNPTNGAEAKAWVSSNPITVLYLLATPTKEERGYVDMPAIPGAATVSIPELDALGVRYLIGDSVREMARQWYERGLAEHGGETLGHVAPVEGETATANHAAGTYLVHDGQLCKVTSAIATGEAISIGTNVTATTVMAEVLALTQ